MDLTEQIKKWAGEFGKEYTNRNRLTIQEMEDYYKKTFGRTRSDMNEEFLSGLDRDIKILEVGSNIGNQLILLKKQGFKNLFGLEILDYALEIAKRRDETEGISFIKGSALDIPFKDGFFDLVFTSGVLIHISPDDITTAIGEICRCAKKYIWGYEYYAESYQKVTYRGHKDLLWKGDFAGMYLDNCSELKIIRKVEYPYIGSELVDQMFLLGGK